MALGQTGTVTGSQA